MAKTQSDQLLLDALGARVRAERERLGISQEELAGRAGLDRTYVSGIERGRRNVAILNLTRLAAALGVDVGVLVGGLRPDADKPPSRWPNEPS